MLIALLFALTVQQSDSIIPADSLDAPPAIVQTPELNYPIDLLQHGRQGRVIVEFVLDTTGHAEKGTIRVVSSPLHGFNLSAKAYVRDAVFEPALFHGRKVRTRLRVPVEFRLHGGS
jgi:TonB family protein